MTTNHRQILYFPVHVYVASWVFPVITGSLTVPVITFLKFTFLKNIQKKSLFRYVFLYLKTYTVLKTAEQLFQWHVFFFFCQMCWSKNCKEGFQQFDSVFYLLNWMTEVCVFCVCAVWTRVTDMTGCIANWFYPVLQVRKGSVTC